jgi:hypothetical protein
MAAVLNCAPLHHAVHDEIVPVGSACNGAHETVFRRPVFRRPGKTNVP